MARKTDPTAALASFLRNARLESGLQQTEVAKATGITGPQISSYEVGRMSPSLTNLVKLCSAYEKTLGQAAQAMGLTDEE